MIKGKLAGELLLGLNSLNIIHRFSFFKLGELRSRSWGLHTAALLLNDPYHYKFYCVHENMWLVYIIGRLMLMLITELIRLLFGRFTAGINGYSLHNISDLVCTVLRSW